MMSSLASLALDAASLWLGRVSKRSLARRVWSSFFALAKIIKLSQQFNKPVRYLDTFLDSDGFQCQ